MEEGKPMFAFNKRDLEPIHMKATNQAKPGECHITLDRPMRFDHPWEDANSISLLVNTRTHELFEVVQPNTGEKEAIRIKVRSVHQWAPWWKRWLDKAHLRGLRESDYRSSVGPIIYGVDKDDTLINIGNVHREGV